MTVPFGRCLWILEHAKFVMLGLGLSTLNFDKKSRSRLSVFLTFFSTRLLRSMLMMSSTPDSDGLTTFLCLTFSLEPSESSFKSSSLSPMMISPRSLSALCPFLLNLEELFLSYLLFC